MLPTPATMAALVTSAVDETPETFTFHHVPEASFAADTDAALKDLLTKWGITQSLQMATFRYDQFYQPHMFSKMALDFLNDKEVQSKFQVDVKKGGGEKQPFGLVSACKVEEVASKRTSFDMFDRLNDSGIVKESGRIQATYETTVDDLIVMDKLREMLAVEDSDDYTLYDDDERNEFLFRLFSHMVIGGGMCQHEDTIQPYFEATKKLYKDLLAVRKHPDNGSIEVVSQVISVRRPGFKSDGAGLFAGKSPFSFCYLIVNPVKRSATIVHFPWTSVWGH